MARRRRRPARRAGAAAEWAAFHEWGPEWASPGEPRGERRRLRHRTDWLSLLGGLLFIGMGVRFIAGPPADPVTMLAVLLTGLAFAGLVAVIVTAARGRR